MQHCRPVKDGNPGIVTRQTAMFGPHALLRPYGSLSAQSGGTLAGGSRLNNWQHWPRVLERSCSVYVRPYSRSTACKAAYCMLWRTYPSSSDGTQGVRFCLCSLIRSSGEHPENHSSILPVCSFVSDLSAAKKSSVPLLRVQYSSSLEALYSIPLGIPGTGRTTTVVLFESYQVPGTVC